MKGKKKKPFCPYCGKKIPINTYSRYLGIWKCDSCELIFEFSKLSKMSKIDHGAGGVLDPARILGPSKKRKSYLSREKFSFSKSLSSHSKSSSSHKK